MTHPEHMQVLLENLYLRYSRLQWIHAIVTGQGFSAEESPPSKQLGFFIGASPKPSMTLKNATSFTIFPQIETSFTNSGHSQLMKKRPINTVIVEIQTKCFPLVNFIYMSVDVG